MSDLSVIVVTHNSAADLPECLSSLFEHRGSLDMRVIVSDSSSSDQTAAVAGRYPVLFLPGENRGFAAANNRALTHPAVAGSRYVLFLNPDTAVRDGTLEELIALCDARPDAGVFSVRQVDRNGRLMFSLNRFPSPARYWLEVVKLPLLRGRKHGVVDDELYARETDFDWAAGAFLLVRSEVLESVGGFDERFFFTSEEVDFCRRAHSAGWRRLYSPSLTIAHRSKLYLDPWRAWVLHEHQVRYARKWFSRHGLMLARAALVVRLAREATSPRRTPELRRAAWFSLRGALELAPPPGPLGGGAPSSSASNFSSFVRRQFPRPAAPDLEP